MLADYKMKRDSENTFIVEIIRVVHILIFGQAFCLLKYSTVSWIVKKVFIPVKLSFKNERLYKLK